MSEVKEEPCVPINEDRVVLGVQLLDGRFGLSATTMLPPGSQGLEAKFYGFLRCVAPDPLAENCLNKGMREA